MSVEWKPLSPSHIQQLFGKTTCLERPIAFRSTEATWFVVLRGEVDPPDSGEETLWWSLCRIEGGECVELARDYGVEEVDGEVVEVSWDGLFPRDWVQDFVEGKVDWVRLSITEIVERFGETVVHEQPQAWRHREGRWYLVLVGERDEETEEEEYAWALVEEACGEYREVAICHPGNGFGEDEDAEGDRAPEAAEMPAAIVLSPASPIDVPATSGDDRMPSGESSEEDDSLSLGDFLDGWWEVPPWAWGERTFARIQAEESLRS